MKNRPSENRLLLLDGLRGIAAYAVVFWHWHHFYLVPEKPYQYDMESQPLFPVFSLFYLHGWLAVPLFFALSGVIFFWLFEERLARRDIGVRQFCIDRFSRIAPLYYATFGAVILLQALYLHHKGHFFVYNYNDLYHAVLNILFMSGWGFEKGWSFNGPVWSISVEIFLYISLVGACLTGRLRYLAFAALLLLGYCLPAPTDKLAMGLTQFYAAGLLFIGFRYGFARSRKATILLCVVTAVICWLAIAAFPASRQLLLNTIAFPVTIVALAAVNFCWPVANRALKWLGDVSFSIYLWHFPLQLIFALVLDSLGYARTVFSQPAMLFGFIAALTIVSQASYSLLECPARRALRRYATARTR
ncbi:acyltransferase family protein [Rhizobium sp. CFBP 8762]|uniref:acyltransferase family protein n=1 Tax=Rhizobium sp. CFBP 8762 TaxID=2775279 RepID=UPI001A7EC0A3|nr:acyltransferase [Rhizobium sp. CFBP 8762]